MESLYAWWLASLILEFGVLANFSRRVWRRMYPRFGAYLALDLTASLVLFWLSTHAPSAYDIPWRTVQAMLIVGRILLVIESYRNLAGLHPRVWRFPGVLIGSFATSAALIFYFLFSRPPIRWPYSALELVFGLIGFSNCFLGLWLIGVIVFSRRLNLNHTRQYWHAVILCVYLMMTAPCYTAASRHIDTIGTALMVVATVCYLAWFVSMTFGKTGVLTDAQSNDRDADVSDNYRTDGCTSSLLYDHLVLTPEEVRRTSGSSELHISHPPSFKLHS